MAAPIVVRAPASSANLGPAFDVLGLALDLPADVGVGAPPTDARAADPHHPARLAFEALGGIGELWVRSRTPPGATLPDAIDAARMLHLKPRDCRSAAAVVS